ncbi:Carbohydrate-binding protein, partial [Phytophthora palmivora]
MRCWTFGALAMLVFGAADALDNCDSNVLVKAYEGLNVNTQLVSCMTQNNFSAALDGSVDLTSVTAASAPEQVKTICASDSCKTILSVLVGSTNFNLTNCIVGNNIVLMTEISNLQATCTALSTATPAPATTAPVATTAAPAPTT